MFDQFDPILYWSRVAIEVHRRDFTFDGGVGVDEAGKGRKSLAPVQGGPTRVSRALAIVHIAMYDALLKADTPAFQMSHPQFASLTSYQPALPPAPPKVSREAAVAGAAAVTIKALFQDSIVDEKLAEYRLHLGKTGQARASIDDGVRYGAAIGGMLLKAREGDGSATPDAEYVPMRIKGTFETDPFVPAGGHGGAVKAVGSTWGDDVALFGGYSKSSISFTEPAVALGDVPSTGGIPAYEAYLSAPNWPADRDLVRKVGAAPGVQGLSRTPEQTLIGTFWGYDGARGLGVPPRLYNQCLHEIADTANLTTEALAVLLALANLGMADAGILSWKEKYTFHVGRPATVLRSSEAGFHEDSASSPTFPAGSLPMPAGGAGSPTYQAVENWLATPAKDSLTHDDTEWAPLGAPQTNSSVQGQRGTGPRTPQFPSYPSGHATFGSVCFGIASEVLAALGQGTDLSFDFVSDEFDGKNVDASGSVRPRHTREMTLAQAIHENAVSRLFLGVHWRMDAVEGVRLGRSILEALRGSTPGPAQILPVSVPLKASQKSKASVKIS